MKALLAFSCLLFSFCNDINKCDVLFVKEYANDLGHYYGFENRVVFDNSQNTTLNFRGSKNYDGTSGIKLIFLSKSNQMHFANDHHQDNRLYIRTGETTDTLISKFYKRDKQPQSHFEETISFEIPASNLTSILARRSTNGGTIALSNYNFTISDDIACSLKQLIDMKK
jgi:hypothetical protein